jgi:hypothetical protein
MKRLTLGIKEIWKIAITVHSTTKRSLSKKNSLLKFGVKNAKKIF